MKIWDRGKVVTRLGNTENSEELLRDIKITKPH